MEYIRQALERARAHDMGGVDRAASIPRHTPFTPNLDHDWRDQESVPETALDARHLESNRIVGHDETDFRAKSFDMLRTQVLQAMDHKNWRILGITSPTPGCGKTVTAINLAFSIARQVERAAFLVDLDLQKPQVAARLGLDGKTGVVSVLEERVGLPDAIVRGAVGGNHINVLPAEATSDPSAWMSSRAMGTLLQQIKSGYPSHTVIVDLPPMLSSDDVIAVLPQLDCVLLVAAVGKSTVAEIEECNRHLPSASVVRLVLNKVPGLNAQYYTHYSSHASMKRQTGGLLAKLFFRGQAHRRAVTGHRD